MGAYMKVILPLILQVVPVHGVVHSQLKPLPVCEQTPLFRHGLFGLQRSLKITKCIQKNSEQHTGMRVSMVSNNEIWLQKCTH